MIRLIHFILVLALALSMLLAAIIGATYRNNNRWELLFTNPDGSRCVTLCLFGIDPATMTFDQIDKMLSAYPLLKRLDQGQYGDVEWVVPARDIHINVIPVDEETYVTVSFMADAPTLGELIVLTGKPDRMAITRAVQRSTSSSTCGYIDFLLKGRLIDFSGDGEHDCLKNLFHKVTKINIYRFNPDFLDELIPWQGFLSDEEYEAKFEELTQGQ
jgi:hypothetical protein